MKSRDVKGTPVSRCLIELSRRYSCAVQLTCISKAEKEKRNGRTQEQKTVHCTTVTQYCTNQTHQLQNQDPINISLQQYMATDISTTALVGTFSNLK